MSCREKSSVFSVVVLLGIACASSLLAANGTFRVVEVWSGNSPCVRQVPHGYQFTLQITFNHKPDIASLSAPGTVRIHIKGTEDGRTALNVAGRFVECPGSPNVVLWISNDTIRNLINPRAGETLEYTVILSGTSAVRDFEGSVLDGNGDGKAGGDFKKVWEVPG